MNILLAKYRDISMDLADASLVVLAQESGVRDIATIDQRDFSVFRTENGKTFSLVF
jgi:predicted nucleic acid-binding protein